MLVLPFLAIGLALAVASGGRVGRLREVRFAGEGLLLLMLSVQMLTPTLAHVRDVPKALVLALWCASFIAVAGLAVANRRFAGMRLVAAGCLSNFLAVVANGGMPFTADAIRAVGHVGSLSRLEAANTYLHFPATAKSNAVVLVDVIPAVLGGSRLVVSLGDVLLLIGVAVVLIESTKDSRRPRLEAGHSFVMAK